jgi:hypothetical protein
VFTLGLRERTTHNHKRLLVFRAIEHRDAGRYKCSATDADKENPLQQEVEIVVVGEESAQPDVGTSSA